MKTAVVLLCLVALVAGLRAPPREERKQLAGPPSDFATMALPSLEQTASESEYTIVDFIMQPDATGKVYTWKGTYSIETHDVFRAALVSPHTDVLELYVKPPGYSEYYLVDEDFFDTPEPRGFISTGPLGIDGNMKPAKTFTFYDVTQGEYEIRVQSTKPITHVSAGKPDGAFLLDSYSNYKMFSHVNTFSLEEGQSVGIVAQLYDANGSWESGMEGRPTPIKGMIKSAEMEVLLPDGQEVEVTMKDDGLTGYDFEANDGIYAATIQALEVGRYIYRVLVKGVSAEGYQFSRSSTHLIEIALPQMTLSGIASQSYDPTEKVLSFHVSVDVVDDERLNRDEEGLTVLAYAQVWGTDSSGLHYVPIAWVEAMVDPTNDDTEIVLDLDEKWVHLAEASQPFQLKSVQLLDRNSFAVLSEREAIYVKSASNAANTILEKSLLRGRLENIKEKIVIDEKMLVGKRPLKYQKNATQLAATGLPTGVLVLVHGYCSGSVWSESEFTNAIEFKDYHESRTNDEFALRVRDFAEANAASFALVGHSQGGMASTHLNTFYWSGLQMVSSGGRKVQSVGTPYQACSMAGVLADIGWFFGAGCGSNYDLSVSGAAVWVRKIPVETAAETYYYTTTYNSGWFASNCVTGSSIILKGPNDGTSEQYYVDLPGGNNMGVTQGWCHASEMKYPAQTTDVKRNAEMSEKAAR